ncbi:uncharacterized protein [Pseudorasbora parva]|uniref:uncharacterized protein n=1 Tax=Pseudorasbora parva TaxID=51549 RepID=UPI00351E3DDB
MSGKKNYSREMLDAALNAVKSGESVRSVSQKFGIPKSTLSDHKLGKSECGPHPNRALTLEEEESLVNYIVWMADHGFPLTRTIVKCLALEIIKESSRKTLVNLETGLSDNWWVRFKARHPDLTTRTPDSLDRARVLAATPEGIDNFFKLLVNIINLHSLQDKPHQLWNCDETGFGDKPKSREKVICQKGKRHIYRQQTTTREHITVHVAVSAAGESVPPFIIYPRCLPSVAYALGGPENSLYGYADKGYMTAELFLKWLDHFIKYAPPARPLVLIMDQHETHCGRQIIDVCRENQIDILLLPPHTTHMLQPLDISVFNPLKGVFSTLASRMGLVRGDMVVGKKHFSAVLKHAYEKAVTAANIKAGFRKAGIYPLSREAVDMTQIVKLIPSSSTAAAAPSSAVPSSTTAVASSSSAVPTSSTAAAAPSSAVPSSTTAVASSSSAVPTSSTAAAAPSSAVPSSTTAVASSSSAVPTSSTAAAAPSSAVPSSTTAVAFSSSAVPTCSPSPVCPTCHKSKKNYLVETGLIPQYLADILVTPTFGQKAEGIRRRVPLQARVITSDDYVAHLDNLEAKEKEKDEQKKKRKEEQEKNREAKRARQAKGVRRVAPVIDDGSYCSICKSTLPPGSNAEVDEWIQCDLCQLWFHMACVGADTVPDGEWLCHKCGVTI